MSLSDMVLTQICVAIMTALGHNEFQERSHQLQIQYALLVFKHNKGIVWTVRQ